MNNSSTNLRPATSDDAGNIRRLILAAGINPLGLDWRRFLVAIDDDGELIGCGQLKPHGDEVLEMASLAVVEEWQGRGIGRRLIEALIEKAEPPLWLMCRSSLVPLYRKFGFKEVGPEQEQPNYFIRMRRAVNIFNTVLARDEYLAIMVRG
jgi:amino-acid N-acetyltransferase